MAQCLLCHGLAFGRRQFRIVFPICSRCTKGYTKGRDIVKALEVTAAHTSNNYIKECLLEAAEIIKQALRLNPKGANLNEHP